MTTEVHLSGIERLLEAARFYQAKGYTYVHAPWQVPAEALEVTKPPRLQLHHCPNFSGGFIVASAEQGFLHIQQEHIKRGNRYLNRWMGISPCFRNETLYDDLHRPSFMKVELIDWSYVALKDLWSIIDDAVEYFNRFVAIDVVENTEGDPLAIVPGFDIVTRRGRIELGSYGVREHKSVGSWIYGTGCAEPRLSYAIEKERGL